MNVKNTKVQVPFEYLVSLYSINRTRPTKDILKFMDLIPYTTASLIKCCFVESKYLNIVFDGFGRLCIIKDMKQEKFELQTLLRLLKLETSTDEYNKIGKILLNKSKRIKTKEKNKNTVFKKSNIIKLKELKFSCHLPIFHKMKNEEICLAFSLIFSQFHIILSRYFYERKLNFLKITENFDIETLRTLTTKEKKKCRFRILNVLIDSIRITKKFVEASFNIKVCESDSIFPIKFIKDTISDNTDNFNKISTTNKLCSNMSLNTKIYRHKYKIMKFLKKLKCISLFQSIQFIDDRILYFSYRNTIFSLFRGLVPYLVIRINKLVYRLFYGRKKIKQKRETKQRCLSNLDIKIKKDLFKEINQIYKSNNKKVFKKRLNLLFNEIWKWKKLGLDLNYFKTNSIETENEETFREILFKFINQKYEILKNESFKYKNKFIKTYERNLELFTARDLLKYNSKTKRRKIVAEIPIYYQKNYNTKKVKYYDLSKNSKIYKVRLTRYLLIELNRKKNELDFDKLNKFIEILNRIPNKPFQFFHSGLNKRIDFEDTQSIISIFLEYSNEYLIARKKFLKRFQIEESDFENYILLTKCNEIEFIINIYLHGMNEHSLSISLGSNILKEELSIKKPNFKIPTFKIRRDTQIKNFLKDQGINLLIDFFFNEIVRGYLKNLIPHYIFMNNEKTFLNYVLKKIQKPNCSQNSKFHVFEYKLVLPIFLIRNLLDDNFVDLGFSKIILQHFIKRLDTKLNYKDMSFIPFFYLNIYSFDDSLQILFSVLISEILTEYEIDFLYLENNRFGILCDNSCVSNKHSAFGNCINSIKNIKQLNADISDYLFIEETKSNRILNYDVSLYSTTLSLSYDVFNTLVFNISKLLSATLSFTDLVERYNKLILSLIYKYKQILFPIKYNCFVDSIIRKIMESINSKMFSRYPLALFYGPPGIGLGLLNIQFHTLKGINKPMENFLNQTNIQLFTNHGKVEMKKYYENMVKYLGGSEEIRKQTFSYGLSCEATCYLLDSAKMNTRRITYRIINTEADPEKYNQIDYNTPNTTNDNLSGKIIRSRAQIRAVSLLPNKYFLLNWLPSLNTSNVFVGEKEKVLKYIWVIGKLRGMKSTIKKIFESKRSKSKKTNIQQNLYDLLIENIKNIFHEFFHQKNILFNRQASELFKPDFIIETGSSKNTCLSIAVTLNDDYKEIYEEYRIDNSFEYALIHVNITNKIITGINCEHFLSINILNDMLKPRIFNNSIYELIEANIRNLLNIKGETKTDIKSLFNSILRDEINGIIYIPKEGLVLDTKLYESIIHPSYSKELNNTEGYATNNINIKDAVSDKKIIKMRFSLLPIKKYIKPGEILYIYSIFDFFHYSIPSMLYCSRSNHKENPIDVNKNIETTWEHFCLAILYIQCINNSILFDISFLRVITNKILEIFQTNGNIVPVDDRNDINIFSFYSHINFLKSKFTEDSLLKLKSIKKEFSGKFNHLSSFLTERLISKIKEKKNLKRDLNDYEIRNLIFGLNILPDFTFKPCESIQVFLNGISNKEFFKIHFNENVKEESNYSLMYFKRDLWFIRDCVLLNGMKEKSESSKKVYLYSVFNLVNRKKEGVYFMINHLIIKSTTPESKELLKNGNHTIFGILQIGGNNTQEFYKEKYSLNISILITLYNNSLVFEYKENINFSHGECNILI